MQDDQERTGAAKGDVETRNAEEMSSRDLTFTRRALLRSGWTAVPALFVGIAGVGISKIAYAGTHTDIHTDAIGHSDQGHWDTDATHGDAGHWDSDFGGHGDIAHEDIALMNNPPHQDEHYDVTHLDTHTDTTTS